MSDKKKILYLTRYSLDEPFNLQNKFDGQLAAFSNLGFDVYFIGYDRNNLYLINGDKKIVYGKTHYAVPSYIHTQFYNDLHKAAIKAIEEIGFDYIYCRSAPLFESSCRVAETAYDKGTKLLVEIPTFPSKKENNSKGIRKAFQIYSKRFDEKYNSMVTCYVVIGENANGEYRGKPAINIENGIDINNVRIRTPHLKKDEVHILCVSAMRYWHGYDKLIKSLARYEGSKKVIIHLVGDLNGECANEWKQLSKDLGFSDRVCFHGVLHGNDLDELVDKCDLGCASLRRQDYSHVSELKTREYTARGIPFIIALQDNTFTDTEKVFWHQVSNNDEIPDMNDIVDFALNIRNDKSVIPFMRKFAEENLSWEKQYKSVFDEIERI